MSIKRNYIYNTLSQILTIFIALLLTPYLSRTLGADGIGKYSYIQANIAYFVVLSKLGIETYGRREIARNRDDKKKISTTFWELQIIHIMTSIVCLILFYMILSNNEVLYGFGYIIIFANCFDIIWFFQAIERFRTISIISCIGRVITLLLCIFLVNNKYDLSSYFVIEITILFITNIVLWLNLFKKIDLISFESLNFKRHFKQLFFYFVPSISAIIFTLLDKTLINIYTDSSFENGYYDQAYKIYNICMILVQSLVTVTAPRMSYICSKNDLKLFADKLRLYIRIGAFFSFSLASTVFIFGKIFIPIYFGEGFDEVTVLLNGFMVILLLSGVTVYIDTLYLVPMGLQKFSSCIVVIGAIIDIITDYILIPKYFARGAVFATIITELFLFISFLVCLAVREKKLVRGIVYDLIKYIVCFAFISLFTKSLINLTENRLINFVVAVNIYAVMIVVLIKKLMLAKHEKQTLED